MNMRKPSCMGLLLGATLSSYASPWPVGLQDSSETQLNQSVQISVLSNDTGDDLTISSVNKSSVKWGDITVNDDNKTLTYKPYKDFIGSDEFWYVLQDNQGRTNAAKVIVEIKENTKPNAWPKATTDNVDADYETVKKIKVLSNDIGIGLKLVEVNAWTTNKGKAWISADDEISYQQYGEARGDVEDEFWYVFEDQWGRRNAAKVIVSLKERKMNPWPTATPDNAVSELGTPVDIPVLANDIGAGLRTIKTNEWTQNGGKTIIVDDYIRYTAPTDFVGDDAFWYVFEDELGRTNSAKVVVRVTGTASTAKSVVEFCGKTYETDGTQANTQLTSLLPEPAEYSSNAIEPTGVAGELGIVDGRRYYLEGSVGSTQTVWMEVDGETTLISTVEANEVDPRFDRETVAIATYKGVFYFIQEQRYLFAHDGEQLIEKGDLLQANIEQGGSSILDPLFGNNTLISVADGQVGDALYLVAANSYSPPDNFASYRTLWRISTDSDLALEKVALAKSGNFSSTGFREPYYYFNKIDHYGYNRSSRNSVEDRGAQQSEDGEVTRSNIGEVDKFVEDRGRLFLLTRYFEYTTYERITGRPIITPYPAKLYAIDNTTNEYVDLATCE